MKTELHSPQNSNCILMSKSKNKIKDSQEEETRIKKNAQLRGMSYS